MEETTTATVATLAPCLPRHAWRLQYLDVPRPKPRGPRFGFDPNWRKVRLHRRGDNLHKRAARGVVRLKTNVVHRAQTEIEMMLRSKGVRWHSYMRELSLIPRGRVTDDRRAYFAFQNAIRKYGRAA